MSQATVITVKEARKLLGQRACTLTDNQMIEIVINLQVLARKFLNTKGSKN